MNQYEKMKELAEEMVNWFRSTYGDLFVDEDGNDDESVCYTARELGAMAVDNLSGEGSKFYLSLSDEEKTEVKELAFDEKLYCYQRRQNNESNSQNHQVSDKGKG